MDKFRKQFESEYKTDNFVNNDLSRFIFLHSVETFIRYQEIGLLCLGKMQMHSFILLEERNSVCVYRDKLTIDVSFSKW